MDLRVNSVHFDADVKLVDFVNQKVNKLGTYHNGLISGEVFLKVDKNSEKDNKVAEVKLHAAGADFFAKKQCKTFEEATDLAVDALKRQIEKNKAR